MIRCATDLIADEEFRARRYGTILAAFMLVSLCAGCASEYPNLRMTANDLQYYRTHYGDGSRFFDYGTIISQERALAQSTSQARPVGEEFGRCNAGMLNFISWSGMFGGFVLYYDSKDGSLVAIQDWGCMARRYWPRRIREYDRQIDGRFSDCRFSAEHARVDHGLEPADRTSSLPGAPSERLRIDDK